MTVGELFVKLGFKLEGESKLTDVMNRVNTASSAFTKLGEELTTVSTKITEVILHSLSASLALSKFSVSTGISTRTLQEWQYTASKFSVTGEEVASTFKNIQNAQAAIALGQGNIAPWQLLGIDPRQDPEQVLLQIHNRIINMREDVARFVTSQMGIGEGMFAVLNDANMTYGQLHEKFIQTKKDQENLLRLNEQFEHLKYQLVAISDKFVSSFRPQIESVLEKLLHLVDVGADFIIWLNSGDEKAQTFKNTLGEVLVILLQVGPAILAIATAVKVLTGALTVLQGLGIIKLLSNPALVEMLVAGFGVYSAYKFIGEKGAEIIDQEKNKGKSLQQIKSENIGLAMAMAGSGESPFDSFKLRDFSDLLFKPTGFSGLTTAPAITNNNNFNIQSSDPKAVASEVSVILNTRNSAANAQIPKRGQ